MRRRRGAALAEASAEPVPTSRATVISPQPFGDRAQADAWLAERRADADLASEEARNAVSVLNRALHAHRVAVADPHTREVSAEQALVVRVGFGSGDAVAEGRYAEAYELAGTRARTRRSMEAPEERFAALLGGREGILACEELVLRARADLDSGRPREAALQARIALESVLAELTDMAESRRSSLESDRATVADAANAALSGELGQTLERPLEAVIERMESALRARRLGSAS
jgi:hypothetical protein